MNNIQFSNGNYDLYWQLSYMREPSSHFIYLTNTLSLVPISLGVIVTSFVLAFSTFVRAILSFIFSISWTYLVTSTRIYELWGEFKIDSQSLAETRKKYVRQMKDKARSKRQARHEKRQDEKAKELCRQEAERVKVKVRTAPEHLLPT
jgi:sensor histidine kinase YesM